MKKVTEQAFEQKKMFEMMKSRFQVPDIDHQKAQKYEDLEMERLRIAEERQKLEIMKREMLLSQTKELGLEEDRKEITLLKRRLLEGIIDQMESDVPQNYPDMPDGLPSKFFLKKKEKKLKKRAKDQKKNLKLKGIKRIVRAAKEKEKKV